MIELYNLNKGYYKIPKGAIINNNEVLENLFVSPGHAIKCSCGEFHLPNFFKGINKCTLKDLEEVGMLNGRQCHIELFCKDGENRRTNCLTTNGIITESYSSDKIMYKTKCSNINN